MAVGANHRNVTLRTRPAPGGWGPATARACDVLLAWCVLALATWTVAYHACLLLDLRASWALVMLAAGSAPCALLARRLPAAPAPAAPAATDGRERGAHVAVAVALGLAGAAAIALAFAGDPWPPAWALWTAAAAAAVIASAGAPLVRGGHVRLGAPAALGWATAIAVLSLFLVRPNADDTYYLRQATWIAEHGRFPLGDTLHSHDLLPAAFSPPLASFEPLLGALAGSAGVGAAALTYLVAGPVAGALAVLALWRLLRTWEVRLVGPALTVAVVFLLTATDPTPDAGADVDHLPGDFFVARAWQGKVVLVAVLVPLLFSLLHDHASRPRRSSLAFLAAAGVAGVGLSTTATFLVPVIALAALAPLAMRAPLRAAAGVAAASAYPAAAMAAALLSDGRQPARWQPKDIAPEALVLPAVGTGVLGLVVVCAALAGPLLLTPRNARRAAAAAALATTLFFAPGVPQLIYDVTGLGRPVWRLMWAMPVAALVGVVATQPAARNRRAAVRVLPALAACALLALAGTPVWEGRHARLAGRPTLELDPRHQAVASRLIRVVRPGDMVLAPPPLSKALLILDGRVTAVAPRLMYTSALPATPAARRTERLLLWAFASNGLQPDLREDRVVAALRELAVDIACVPERAVRAVRLLAGAGYDLLARLRGVWCGRWISA